MSGKKAAHNAEPDAEGECKHQIVMKDMCATCGKDLRPWVFIQNIIKDIFCRKDGFVGQRTEAASASVSMIHHVPELLVSDTVSEITIILFLAKGRFASE